RVDDRGAGASTGQQTYNQATTADLAGDTRAQVEWLRRRPEVDPARIALVGHSEGATIATFVAAADPRIAAVVTMAGAGKRGDSVLVDQLDDILSRNETLTAEQRAQAQAQQREAFRTLRAGGEVPGETRTVWMRAFIDFDPIPTVRRVRQPLLILQGALDRQVTAPQAAALAEAARAAGNPDVTVTVFPSLNHLFLPAKTGAFSEYSTLDTTTLGPDVLGTLADWLAVRLRAAH
ncbi:MAG TPA: alpha/beta fold hydrolase, partial [Gemmatimonadaceae bacterium]|nr:alpha/beta fold hydrolase [Gemmatimonadaceae bacterium]